LSTDTVSSITSTIAQCGGTISAYDEDTVLLRGYAGAHGNRLPLKNDTTSDGYGTGKFISRLTRLSLGTRYYVRAYLINRKGIAYGDERTFKTTSSPVFNVGEIYGGGMFITLTKPVCMA